jgi:hypothetical protein
MDMSLVIQMMPFTQISKPTLPRDANRPGSPSCVGLQGLRSPPPTLTTGEARSRTKIQLTTSTHLTPHVPVSIYRYNRPKIHSLTIALSSKNSEKMVQKKSLLVGINYTGSDNELRGCHQDVENVAEFLSFKGYSNDPRSQVILRDDKQGQYYPSGHNILVRVPSTSSY